MKKTKDITPRFWPKFFITFVEGKEKSGKTTLLKYLIQKKHFTYCIVNTIEDIKKKYKNEDWLILDNFDDEKLHVADLIFAVMVYFNGKNLVITSSKPLNKWYDYEKESLFKIKKKICSTLDVFVSLIDVYIKCEKDDKTILADIYIGDTRNEGFVLTDKKTINSECFSHCERIDIDKFYQNKDKIKSI